MKNKLNRYNYTIPKKWRDTANRHNYKIPKEWKNRINENFIEQMMYELYRISGISLDVPYYKKLIHIIGTYAWTTAFAMACIKTDNDDLYKYYKSLEFEFSEDFEYEVSQLFIDYKFIMNNSLVDIVSQNTRYKSEDLRECEYCNHIFPKVDMIKKIIPANEKNNEEIIFYICEHCFEKSKKQAFINQYYLEAIKTVEEHFLSKI